MNFATCLQSLVPGKIGHLKLDDHVPMRIRINEQGKLEHSNKVSSGDWSPWYKDSWIHLDEIGSEEWTLLEDVNLPEWALLPQFEGWKTTSKKNLVRELPDGFSFYILQIADNCFQVKYGMMNIQMPINNPLTGLQIANALAVDQGGWKS